MKRNRLTQRQSRITRRVRKQLQAYLIAEHAFSRAEAKEHLPLSAALCAANEPRYQAVYNALKTWPFCENFDYSGAVLAARGHPLWTERDEQELLRYNAGPL